MSEGKLLSRKQIVERIAEVEKIKSQLNWPNNDCLPQAVALTHGYPKDAHKLGLHARTYVHQAMEAAKIIAERNGEVAQTDLFVLENNTETRANISQDLKSSEKFWIFFGDGEKSHALGILKLDDNEFLVANLSEKSDYLIMSNEQIIEHLLEYSNYMQLGACIIGFKKNE